METEKYVFRVEVSFTVDIIAEDNGEAERKAYDAFMRGDYNPTPNGGTVAEIHTQAWEAFEMEDGDEVPEDGDLA